MKKLLIFVLLLGLLMAMTSCQLDATTEEGEYYEIDIVQYISDWSANNELSLFWEIVLFILAIPLIIIALALVIIYIVISWVFELVATLVVMIVVAIGAIVSLAMGFFGS